MRGARALKVAAGLIVVLALGALGGRAYVRSGLPRHDGTARLPGASQEVLVTRDEHGIPSIWAASEDDAYRALGFTHAQDRLWQMEFFRRVADGRLAEIFGGDLVETDAFMRTLGLGRAAEADERLLDEPARRAVEAYVAGVNTFMSTRTGPLPPEFLVLRFSPEPWTVRSALSIAKIIAADLASWSLELEHQRAIDTVGEARAIELAPQYPEWGPLILGQAPDDASGAREDVRLGFAAPPLRDVPGVSFSDTTREVLATISASHASNAWVIGGKKTASGKPIIANDTHLTLRAPSLFYLVAIHGGAVQRAGVTIPGFPGVILGKAPGFAWGFTDAMVDDVDFYVEKTEGAGEGSYVTPSGPRPFDRREENIKVRSKPDVVHVVRSTRHGPVVSDVDKRAGARVLSMRWTAIEPATGMNALLRMNRATTWKGLVEASREFDTAKQNMVFGADDGTIGYVLLGKVPLRKRGDGLLPVPGWTDEYEWERYLTPEEKPSVVDPAEGFIVTANNRQRGADYPFLLTRIWASPFRALRIRELVSAGEKMTAADVARHQMDVSDSMAKRYLPFARKAAELAGIENAKRELAAWDGEARPGSRGAAFFYLWIEALRRRVGEDEWKGAKMYFPRSSLLTILDRGASAWIDDVRTPEVESLDDMMREAMKDAAAEAADSRTWGEFHATHLEHPLGRVKMLDRVFGFNVGPVARGGASHTVNVAPYSDWKTPFKSTEGASHREIVDIGDDNAGGFVVPTGQAGHPSSANYRDLHAKWLQGVVVPMPLDRAASDARAVARLRLEP